jgi:hypothetical protein
MLFYLMSSQGFVVGQGSEGATEAVEDIMERIKLMEEVELQQKQELEKLQLQLL